ncbi:MAG: preprotein translocase subunit SecG [Methylococcaceae bacterium]|nr:preprotein translocase subunit SecG [Methylococcaceae bacterium]
MYQIIIVVHVLLGLSVIGFVLIQQGKGADAGAAFGSASSGSVFGAQGASSFLSRTTAILASLFFATSLGLAVMSGNVEGEVDLMGVPAGEEVFEDVPLVNGSETIPTIDSLPVVKQELPTEVVRIQEEIATMADTVETEAVKVVE